MLIGLFNRYLKPAILRNDINMDSRFFLKLFLLFILCFPGTGISAQTGRSYIKSKIQAWGECRNVAITKTNGDLALYGLNGSARSGCPSNLNQALDELNRREEYIDDVQLTEEGRYVILYGNNGIVWNDIPYSLEKQLRMYNREEEVITAVTFNDKGEWIVITTHYMAASDPSISQWLKEGNRQHGKLWTACITDDALVAVYENGYRFKGNVPDDLRQALRSTKLDVIRLKIAGSAWFFADSKSRYRYSM